MPKKMAAGLCLRKSLVNRISKNKQENLKAKSLLCFIFYKIKKKTSHDIPFSDTDLGHLSHLFSCPGPKPCASKKSAKSNLNLCR